MKGVKSILSIRERLNKKKNQEEIPLEELEFLNVAKITESSELPSENQNVTRKQLVAFVDVKDSGIIERILTILPDEKVLQITPDENSRICISSN